MDITKFDRDELLPYVINTYKLQVMIEVGVREADNIRNILTKTNIKYIIGIDIQKWPKCEKTEQEFKERFKFYLDYSLNAINHIRDNSIDLVYIDASHKYEDVKQDIEAWYYKVKDGGFLIGDDYCSLINPHEGRYGVVEAIEEFCLKNNIDDIFISGIGKTSKMERLKYAQEIGKKHEDNLLLGYAEHYPVNPALLVGRKITQGTPVPQWIIRKNDIFLGDR